MREEGCRGQGISSQSLNFSDRGSGGGIWWFKDKEKDLLLQSYLHRLPGCPTPRLNLAGNQTASGHELLHARVAGPVHRGHGRVRPEQGLGRERVEGRVRGGDGQAAGEEAEGGGEGEPGLEDVRAEV